MSKRNLEEFTDPVYVCDTCATEAQAGQRQARDVRWEPVRATRGWQAVGELDFCPQHPLSSSPLDQHVPFER